MHTLILVSIILLATLENYWPLIAGYRQTPIGFTFLGTVHHPGDYFYYLSQFAQGAYRTVTTVDLYTSESLPPSLVGWSNVLLGKFFSLLHVEPIVGYHISVAVLTILVFVSAYILCHTILKSKGYAIFSLYLFMLFHAFPLLRDGTPSYGDYWNNFAVPRVRIGAVPHQLLIAIASFILVQGIFRRTGGDLSTRTLMLIVSSSVILGSLQPILWAITIGTFLLSYVATQRLKQHTHRAVDVHGILALSSGAIPVLYLYVLFQSLPFSQLKLWEAAQQTTLTLEHFISATGPLMLIAITSIPFVLTSFTVERLFLVVFTSISMFMLVTPLSAYIHISHVRFMSTLTILLLSIMATIGIRTLVQTHHRILTILTYLSVLMLSLYLLPNHLKTIRLSSTFNQSNIYEYLPTQDYRFFRSMASMGEQNDVFLVAPPHNELFPGISGKRSYNGHHLLTIQASEKDAHAAKFFGASMSADDMHAFLTSQSISWVISPPNQPILNTSSWASIRAKTDNLVLYAIQK